MLISLRSWVRKNVWLLGFIYILWWLPWVAIYSMPVEAPRPIPVFFGVFWVFFGLLLHLQYWLGNEHVPMTDAWVAERLTGSIGLRLLRWRDNGYVYVFASYIRSFSILGGCFVPLTLIFYAKDLPLFIVLLITVSTVVVTASGLMLSSYILGRSRHWEHRIIIVGSTDQFVSQQISNWIEDIMAKSYRPWWKTTRWYIRPEVFANPGLFYQEIQKYGFTKRGFTTVNILSGPETVNLVQMETIHELVTQIARHQGVSVISLWMSPEKKHYFCGKLVTA